ncbi:hypothetical protein LBMAG52_26330 [Planctomycetia bacterium]|nr:hypothetical protein LBMAG52_26330 [Planctomycetia bacterium]
MMIPYVIKDTTQINNLLDTGAAQGKAQFLFETVDYDNPNPSQQLTFKKRDRSLRSWRLATSRSNAPTWE